MVARQTTYWEKPTEPSLAVNQRGEGYCLASVVPSLYPVKGLNGGHWFLLNSKVPK